jgi:hypothetical protein
MATTSCQNDAILLTVAREVGRKAFSIGLGIDFNHNWYSPVEHDAFVSGWLEAATESSCRETGGKIVSAGFASS